jgi:hypothetical protein
LEPAAPAGRREARLSTRFLITFTAVPQRTGRPNKAHGYIKAAKLRFDALSAKRIKPGFNGSFYPKKI